VEGCDSAVLTSLLLDEDGIAIGTTMYHHLVHAGPAFRFTACGLNSAIRPRRTHSVRRAAERTKVPQPGGLAQRRGDTAMP